MNVQVVSLVLKYYKKHHPLACGMEPDEFPQLIYRVARLFQGRNALLDPSPSALWRIRTAAEQCAQDAARSARPFEDEEHLLIVRGLTACIGSALLTATGGTWQNGDHLLSLAIDTHFSMVLARIAERRTVTHTHLSVGMYAALVWGAAVYGDAEPVGFPVRTGEVMPDGCIDWEMYMMHVTFEGSERNILIPPWHIW